MKNVIRIIVLAVFFYLSLLLVVQESSAVGQDLQEQILQERAAEKEPPAKEKTFRTINEQTPDAEDDEYVPYYEHEIFSNKLYEKKLPPMSRKEKIVWSFRMAETNFFL